MTALDGLLILVGLIVIIVCAMDGVLRALVMLVSFYLISTATGLVTLATDVLHGIAGSIASVTGSSVPNIVVTQTFVFVVLTAPLFIGAYFIGKVIIEDTTLPKLQVLDNILGAIIGIVLALLIMALIYNTWGAAVSVRWNNVQAWNSMWMAYANSWLRPHLREILVTSRPIYIVFSYLEYPLFFTLQA